MEESFSNRTQTILVKSKKRDELLFLELQSLASFPFYAFLKSKREDVLAAREAFFASGTLPNFPYQRAHTFDAAAYIESAESFQSHVSDSSEDPKLCELYEAKCEELIHRAKLILAIQEKNDENITAQSEALFGEVIPKDELHTEWKDMVKNASQFHEHKKPVDAEAFKEMVERVLTYYDMHGFDVRLSNRSSVKVTHRVFYQPRICIPKTLQISRARAARLLTHEVEVHALRTWNGIQSPYYLLWRGLDRYLRTDEGLAVHFQVRVSGTEPKHAPGFWDAYSVSLAKVGSFTETFEALKYARTELAEKMGKKDPESIGQDSAWRLCLRAYRGITDLSEPGVGFFRDHIYRSGLRDVRKAIEKYGTESVGRLFVGNVGIHHLPLLEHLSLKNARTPDMVSKHIVQEVMRKKK